MSHIAIAFILLYRRLAYPIYRLLGLQQICTLEPSCSRFAEEAFRRHGFFKTCVMVAARLYECGNTRVGNDPVPQTSYTLSAAERRNGATSLLLLALAAIVVERTVRRSGR